MLSRCCSKCLNVRVEAFQRALTAARIHTTTSRGKWLLVETSQGWLLLNLGMGGEILLTGRQHLPEKRRIVFDLDVGAALAVNFCWFGYCHYAMHPAAHSSRLCRGRQRNRRVWRKGRRCLGFRRGREFRSRLRPCHSASRRTRIRQRRRGGIEARGDDARRRRPRRQQRAAAVGTADEFSGHLCFAARTAQGSTSLPIGPGAGIRPAGSGQRTGEAACRQADTAGSGPLAPAAPEE